MKSLRRLFIILLLCGYPLLMLSQEALTSDAAYQKYEKLSATMAISFPEDNFKTYRRTSFSVHQLETYLSQQFQRLDCLPFIKDKHAFVMDAYLHSGNWFHEIGLFTQSIASYTSFFEYYEAHKMEFTPEEVRKDKKMISFANSIMAENYANLNQLDSASKQHIKNIRFTNALRTISNPSAINNYGLFFYWNTKELDSALIYFNKAYAITQKQFPEHSLNGSIRDNIADIYMDQHRYAEAKEMYVANFALYKTKHIEKIGSRDIPRLISAGAQLVQTNLALNDIKDAKIIFPELDSIVKDAKKQKELLPDSKLEYLHVKENFYKATNNLPLAFTTLKYSTAFSDSLATVASKQDNQWKDELNAVTLDRVALNFEIERIEKENKIKDQSAKLWIISLISAVLIILLIVLYLGRRQHLLNSKNKQLLAEHELENAALKVEQLHSEIKSKQRDLSDFALSLTQNQEWAEMLADKIKMLKNATSEEHTTILEKLEEEIKNKVQFDKDSIVFYERLDKLNDAFYTHLSELFPNLTKNEIRLCSLIRLKMDSRNIATLQNIAIASLNTSRYRLRKKMKLADDVHLDDFIQQL
ncbi:hypothetical protein FG167_13930 [Lacinutrix sp. WUR7]|uniref:transcriptional regulator n=1 Tax=Lacinutrix sp. WUR7 TaxID=2653681 RepID=UPI00193CE037|nr:tetratricopeptide repeat protein [Lacinutrix sp. WUR7]QRM90289.1 hypothetical protein FG167_13930 [Lacinutrix sp. WUR7]